MGSFANSIHVRSNDATAVVAALEDALASAGFAASGEATEQAGVGPAQRGIHVSEVRDGWVSVLDSNLGASRALAQELSSRLDTVVLAVLVNDSDSWLYGLFDRGHLRDEFESVDEDEEAGGGSADVSQVGELLQLVQSRDEAGIQRLLGPQIERMRSEMEATMPPDILEIYRRMQQGQATPDENRQYALWVQKSMRQQAPRLSLGGGLLSGLFSRRSAPAKRPTTRLKAHLEHLRPVLAPGVTDKKVLQALGKQSDFAEEDLRDFLPLVGIAALYAFVGYDYLPEMGEAELEAAGIRFTVHRLYLPRG